MKEILEKYKTIIGGLLGQTVDVNAEAAPGGSLPEKHEPVAPHYYSHFNKGIKFSIHTMVGGYRTEVAYCWMTQLPGCCGVAVFHGTQVYFSWRNKGIAKVLQEMRTELAKAYGFTVVICSDVKANPHQRRILEKNGWKDLMEFKNKRTANLVAVSGKTLS